MRVPQPTSAESQPRPSVRPVVMHVHSHHKHTVRYSSPDPDVAVGNVYVKRTAFGTMPDTITVTIEAGRKDG